MVLYGFLVFTVRQRGHQPIAQQRRHGIVSCENPDPGAHVSPHGCAERGGGKIQASTRHSTGPDLARCDGWERVGAGDARIDPPQCPT